MKQQQYFSAAVIEIKKHLNGKEIPFTLDPTFMSIKFGTPTYYLDFAFEDERIVTGTSSDLHTLVTSAVEYMEKDSLTYEDIGRRFFKSARQTLKTLPKIDDDNASKSNEVN